MAAAGWKRDDSSNGAPISENTSDDYDDGYPYNDGDGWWWSPTGMAVRYTVICIIFAAILVFFVGGYLHAKRRMRKGLPLLAYHRWMVHRSVRYQYQQPEVYSPYNNSNNNNPDPYQEGYVMHGYAPPPPAYHRYGDAPPAYAPPPAVASKAMADQHYYNSQDQRTRNEGESSEAAATSAAVPRQ